MKSVFFKKIFVLTIACAVVFVLFAPAVQADNSDTVRIMVQMDQSEKELTADSLSGREIREIRKLESGRGKYGVSARREKRTDRWRVVEVETSKAQEIYEKLKRDKRVSDIHFEKIYHAAVMPNDPRFPEQYGLFSNNNPLVDIKAPQAWRKTTGSPDVVIAIVDSGVDITHEDLQDRLWVNKGEVKNSGRDNDNNGYIDDMHGWDFVAGKPAGEHSSSHATHIAGIAAAGSNNGRGITGVDWKARIMSVRVLDYRGRSTEEHVVNGINYAVQNGAHVINLSLMGPRSSLIQAAIRDAYDAGVVVVAAAGNMGADTGRFRYSPVCDGIAEGVNMVIGVAATDRKGGPASFSNYGECIDIAAPGDKILSTVNGNKYGTMSGTSMSAPFVTGVAALYLSLNPQATPAEVIKAVTQGDQFDGRKAEVWQALFKGRLNAAKALGEVNENDNREQHKDEDTAREEVRSDKTTPPSDNTAGRSPVANNSANNKPPASNRVVYNEDLIPRINAAFRSVFGRNPTAVEHRYWYERVKRGDKNTWEELRGAMSWQKLHGRTYDLDHYNRLIVRRSTASVAGIRHHRNQSLIVNINALHRFSYGRNPTAVEHAYWLGRVISGDKSTMDALLGAMQWQKEHQR